MKTLVLTGYVPKLDTGRGVRTYGVVAALARSDEVEVAYLPFDGLDPAPAYAELANTTLTRLGGSRGLDRGLAYLKARARGASSDLARGVYAELEATARRTPLDVRIVADGVIPATALLGIARRRPFVYCAHNLESSFRHTIEGTRMSKAALERFERRLLRAASESWMVSRADVAGARELCPTAHVRLVPNVVDTAAIEPIAPPPGSRRILLVADLTYSPNRVGFEFLRDEVRPLLRARIPDAEIVVVGRGAQPGDESDGVTLLGRVEDLGAVYREAAVVAVPLLQGGGSPLKFVEALAHGLPIVATPKAAAGLDVEAGTHYYEAADAEQFAAALAEALQDADPTMGTRAREFAIDHYSIEALAEQLRSTDLEGLHR